MRACQHACMQCRMNECHHQQLVERQPHNCTTHCCIGNRCLISIHCHCHPCACHPIKPSYPALPTETWTWVSNLGKTIANNVITNACIQSTSSKCRPYCCLCPCIISHLSETFVVSSMQNISALHQSSVAIWRSHIHWCQQHCQLSAKMRKPSCKARV